mmetsp:Transcript_19085/g.24750  ORF Transcript_19085/g.24750 Transcript_19085/m.24750 type:complete len:283 (-) Transcript_19085:123-971(-)
MRYPPCEVLRYGNEEKDQYVRLHRRKDNDEEAVFIIIHGGFWKENYSVENAGIDTLAPYILSSKEKKFAVAEIEYRRRESGGGWPNSCQDMLMAVEKVRARYFEHEDEEQQEQKNKEKIKKSIQFILLGHSAGGHGALFVANYFQVALCIAVAPVADLLAAHERKLSDDGDAAMRFVLADRNINRAKESLESLLIAASPVHSMLPLKCPTLIVTGLDDHDVPPEMTHEFALKAKQAAKNITSNVDVQRTIEFLQIPGADHFSLLDASSPYWITLWTTALKLL